jgi:hypothetical protein
VFACRQLIAPPLFFSAAVRASSLETLDIRDAALTDDGGGALLNLLNAARAHDANRHCPPPLITALHMGHCGISYTPHTAIHAAVKGNRRQHNMESERRLFTQLTRAAYTLKQVRWCRCLFYCCCCLLLVVWLLVWLCVCRAVPLSLFVFFVLFFCFVFFFSDRG